MQATAAAHTREGTLIIALGGDWSIDRAPPRFAHTVAKAVDSNGHAVQRVAFDARTLGRWDTSLLLFLMQGQQFCEQHALPCDTDALPEQLPRLLALARAVPERTQEAPPPPGVVTRVGLRALRLLGDLREAVTFLGQVALSAAGLVVRRTRLPWRDFWVVVQSNSSGALPIVTLIALLVGVIMAFLGVVVLKRFGAGYYVSYLVGFGMLREMGALMTGIIMAGRTGAAFAAELGSMKITEEIDAFTTLGIAPVDYLVLPRVLGIFCMMPLLTVYADFIGIAGGMLVSATLLDLSFRQFFSGLLAAVTISDALLGVLKGVVYGAIIGVAGCMKGLQTGADAGAVGRSTTSAVVLAITLIIMANAVIDWLAALLDV